ncbi:acyl-CoA dehydrogenase family protein [Patulibacter sp. NPDC049589]|uniref:acyl-CoA dehydrogenase family protein n=1 Tax=Patulibacter sp. NPDC049589 TaxID=3154731 RepID=UPI0034184DDB
MPGSPTAVVPPQAMTPDADATGEATSGTPPDPASWSARLADAVRGLPDDVVARDAAAEPSRVGWERISATGLFGLPFRADRRRSDEALPAIVAGLETVAHATGDAGLGFAASTQLASAVVPLARFGTPDLRERYGAGLAAGTTVGAHAITEPHAGSDVSALRTTARRDGATFVLDGDKAFVSNGPAADLFVVYAATGDGDAFGGLTAFLVERTAPGLTVGPALATAGLRTCPLGRIGLRDVRVHESHVVGQPGAGSWLLGHVMAREILFIAAGHVGIMRRRLEQVVARVTEREQFGQPIGAFQAVSHAVADLHVQTETAAKWVRDTTARLANGEDATAEIAATKLVVSEANVTTARTAVQLFGGDGFLVETGIERGLRDAVAGTIYSGTSEIQRNKLAALLGVLPTAGATL